MVTTLAAVLRELEVARVQDVTVGMRRVTLTGPQLGAFDTASDGGGVTVPAFTTPGFDDHVKVLLPSPGHDRPVLPVQEEGRLDWTAGGVRAIHRDYTPRRWDARSGELDLDFVDHPAGHAASWVGTLQPGDPAWIVGPTLTASLPHGVDWLLVAGDETALPAIGRLLEELGPDHRAKVFVEVADADHEQVIETQADVELTWLHRDGAPPGSTDLLPRAVTSTSWWQGQAFAWVSGESSMLRPIRQWLKTEHGLTRDCLDLTGYWRRS
ncbi:siderophore-interacting protein [Aeromicrobium sp. CTD01-1L150]|uniref:siderophore-interacting protein n=1 Tax=Aeromicrobium sp. CTD01-1L150 TaxID=3341830 RepID=UPI0035C204B9